MNSFLSSIGLTVIFVVTLSVLRGIKGQTFIPFSACVSVLLVGFSLSVLQPLIESISNVVSQGTSDIQEYLGLLLKALGVSLTTSFASDLCRDAGETAIANGVELLGKCEILALSIPLIKKLSVMVMQAAEAI